MLPRRLKSLRKKQEIPQQNIANFPGITRQGFANYENGQSEPDNKTLGQLVDYFEVPTDFILKGTDNPSPYNNDFDPIAEINNLLKNTT